MKEHQKAWARRMGESPEGWYILTYLSWDDSYKVSYCSWYAGQGVWKSHPQADYSISVESPATGWKIERVTSCEVID